MSRFTDRSMVAVQVETGRADVWVPEGLALPQRTYEPNGVMYDCTRGLVFPTGTTTRVQPDRTARTFKSTKTNWVINVNSSGTPQKAVDLGPVLAHSRMAIPVAQGMKVNWSGSFRCRQTGYNPSDDEDNYTSINIRVVLWGTKNVVDEYGVESVNQVQLIAYQAEMQPFVYGFPQFGYRSFTLPTVSDATVPADVDRVHLSVTMHHATNGRAFKGQYRSYAWGALDTDFFAVFTANPLRVYVKKPDLVNRTDPNALSATGRVFRNRKYFQNMPPLSEAVLTADAGATAPVDVDVWAWTGSARAGLLQTVTLAPGQRVRFDITTPTGRIEFASTGNYGVERVTARNIESLQAEQNTICQFVYADVIDEVNQIQTEAIEADLAVTTIRFVSDTISAQLVAGRRIRILGKRPDGFDVIYTGTIRARKMVHTLGRKDQVELIVHTDFGTASQSPLPVAYDQMNEYGPVVHRTGVQMSIDDVDYTGPAGPLPDGWDYFPSYSDPKLTLGDSLLMVRNTNKGFLFVDRHNTFQLRSTLPTTTVLDLSDVPGEGHMSYTRQIEGGADTSSIVNAIEIKEHLLDRDDFLDRDLDSEEPPIMQLANIASKTRRIEYRRPASISLYGLQRQSFDVVRGTGNWDDLIADRYGTTFATWAAAVLDEYANDRDDVNKVRLVVTETAHIGLVSKLQPLDAVVVRFRGKAAVRRIRRIEHTIRPNKWVVDIRFDAGRDQVLWLPATPVPPAVPTPPSPPWVNPNWPDLSLYPATNGAEGGDVSPALSSSLDGGAP